MKFRSLIKSSLVEQLQQIAENLRTYAQETDEYLQSSTGEGLTNINNYNNTANYIQEGNANKVTALLQKMDKDTKELILDMITESPEFKNIIQLKIKEDEDKVIFGPKTGKESYPMGYSDEGRFQLYVVRDLLPRIKDIDLASTVWKTLEKFDERKPNVSKEDIELIMKVFSSAQKQGLLKRYMSGRKVPIRNTEESVHVYENCGCGSDIAPEAGPQFKLFMWNPMTGQFIPLDVANVEDMGPIDNFHTSYSGEY
jgi:hypothetical protein